MGHLVTFLLLATIANVGVTSYEALAGGGTTFLILDTLFSAFCVAAMYIGLRRRRPTPLLPWVLVVGALAFWVVGDVIYGAMATANGVRDGSPPFPGPPDVFYMAAYPTMAVGLAILHHRRKDPHRLEGRIDAAIVSASLGFVAYVTLLEPIMEAKIADGVAQSERLFSLVYPAADILLLAMLTRIVVGRTSLNLSARCLAASVATLLSADVLFLLSSVRDADYDWAAGALFRFSYVLLAASTMHPSIQSVTERIPWSPPRVGFARIALLSGIVLLAPVVVAWRISRDQSWNPWAYVVGSGILFVLVIARLIATLHRLERTAVKLEATSKTDHLTQLPNRRGGEEHLSRFMDAIAGAPGPGVSVAMINIDGFAEYVDAHDVAVGDELLSSCVNAWKPHMGRGQTLVRHARSEFLLILPGYGAGETTTMLARFANAMPAGHTFSAGVATWQLEESSEMLLDRADDALDEARAAGGDRTISWAPVFTTMVGGGGIVGRTRPEGDLGDSSPAVAAPKG